MQNNPNNFADIKKTGNSGSALLIVIVITAMLGIFTYIHSQNYTNIKTMLNKQLVKAQAKAVLRSVAGNLSCSRTFNYAMENGNDISCSGEPYTPLTFDNQNLFAVLGVSNGTAVCNANKLSIAFEFAGRTINASQSAESDEQGICESYLTRGPQFVYVAAQTATSFEKHTCNCGAPYVGGVNGCWHTYDDLICPAGYTAVGVSMTGRIGDWNMGGMGYEISSSYPENRKMWVGHCATGSSGDSYFSIIPEIICDRNPI